MDHANKTGKIIFTSLLKLDRTSGARKFSGAAFLLHFVAKYLYWIYKINQIATGTLVLSS